MSRTPARVESFRSRIREPVYRGPVAALASQRGATTTIHMTVGNVVDHPLCINFIDRMASTVAGVARQAETFYVQ
jgi:hypothetical protein